MKGSGFSLQGILYIVFIMIMLALFIGASLYIGLHTKKIVLEERVVDKTKETMEIIDTTLDPTFSISFVQSVFAAGQGGFGNEYWFRRASPAADAITSIPAKEDIETGLRQSIIPYLALPGTAASDKEIELDGVSVEIRDPLAVFTADAENGRITSKISATVKARSGLENDQRTKMEKRVKKENAVSISLKKLMDSGKSLASRLSSLAMASYSGPATAYVDSASKQIRKVSDDLPLSTKTSTVESRLVVPETLSGLYLHYNLRSEFLDDEKANVYDYLDEKKNAFEKKPFSLAVKAEDYVPVLNCATTSGLFTYAKDNDMACDGWKIYSCNTPIEGIGGNLKTCGGRTGTTGNYGCGNDRFKDSKAVDDSPCYCTAFGGNWVGGETWTCPRTVCTPVYDSEGKQTGEDCKTVYEPGSCPTECDKNGRSCTPNRC